MRGNNKNVELIIYNSSVRLHIKNPGEWSEISRLAGIEPRGGTDWTQPIDKAIQSIAQAGGSRTVVNLTDGIFSLPPEIADDWINGRIKPFGVKLHTVLISAGNLDPEQREFVEKISSKVIEINPNASGEKAVLDIEE